MDTIRITVTLMAVIKLVVSQLKASDYVINVTPNCPPNITSGVAATITVVTDLPETDPMAICADDWDFYFELQPDGRWTMPAYFEGNTMDICVFKKKSGSNVYTIEVSVPLSSTLITFDSPMHVVVCNYDEVGSKDSSESEFGDSTNPVQEIQQHMAEVSQSDVSICPANVLGNCITGGIQMGRTIMLKATLIGDYPDEVSFQALSCKVVGRRSEYSILLGGCGDGVVIPKNKGFITTGKTAKSPFFKSFRLQGSRRVTFECSFVVCSTPCDGSSCDQASRRKRDTSSVITMTSSFETPRV